MPSTFLVAGVSSGVGKTTVAAGLLGAFRRRGCRVQGYKVGPDYIDPTYHTLVTGRPCRNLDSWMLPLPTLLELFQRSAAGVDIAVVEGVMGLYDGRTGQTEEGSTAEVAKALGLPVLLVVDVGKMARSAAAMAKGYQTFDPDLRLAGVVLNQVGSDRHREAVTDAIRQATSLPVLGWLPKRDDLRLPERHLGLVPTGETPVAPDFFDRLIAQVEASFDLDRIEALAAVRTHPAPPTGIFPPEPLPRRARLGVAMDKAFGFYYQDSLDLLADWGGDIVPFSPVADGALPEGVDGLYFGGGFPELFAADLAANRRLRRQVRAAAAAGLPVYAECGGLMYLCRSIIDFEDRSYPMVGLLPARSRMQRQRLRMGYATLRARRDTPLLRQGEEVRAHEFHWSVLDRDLPAETAAYAVADQGERPEGLATSNLLASYMHLHFAARPDLAPRFVAACAAWRASQPA